MATPLYRSSDRIAPLVREAGVLEPRHLRQEFRISASGRQDPRLLGPMLVGPYPTEDGLTPLLRSGRDAVLWLGAASFDADAAWGLIEIAVLLALEDAAGNRFRMPTALERKRDDGDYEERWLRTTIPEEAVAGPATFTLWARSAGSEAVYERSLRVVLAEPEPR